MNTEALQIDFPVPARSTSIINSADPGSFFAGLPERTVFITDRRVNHLYGRLLPSTCPRLVLPPGEKSKTHKTVMRLYRGLVRRRIDRSYHLVGFGGGVVCDTAAFVAATYMRGIPCGLVPTTLLSQVDAAHGGKNGVNFIGFKNLIGTIRQPTFVLISPVFLKTLSNRDLACGFSELIKTAAVADAELFSFLEKEQCSLKRLEKEALTRAVMTAVGVKTDLVKKDEFEKGIRKTLNFGHTLGHALERSIRMEHGAAVAVGMAAAAEISEHLGLLSANEKERLLNVLSAFDLPLRINSTPAGLFRALRADKKKSGSLIDLILLRKIGRAEIVSLDRRQVEQYYHDLHLLR
ncbi:MAG TPA: 3-dehydroquinate synthase [Candidatus Aminicenantes bacterium]|nr:3-dehydroquinate synthase [Candidatus Aminicenantes bacterium]